jgi:hypothetical protein
VSYQAISSDNDPNAATTGSVLFTAGATFCSLSQDLIDASTSTELLAAGQVLTVSADIAWDGDWDYLYFGFYEENTWDRVTTASVDITLTIPADTDGVLDSFGTVVVSGALSSSGNPVRVFFGSSCDPWSGGSTTGASQFAVDNIVDDSTSVSISEWMIYY